MDNCIVLSMFFVCLFLFAMLVTILCMALSKKQIFRRVSRSIGPCPFGCGTVFEIAQKRISKTAPTQPVICFSTSLFGRPSSAEFQRRYYSGLKSFLTKLRNMWSEATVRIYMGSNIPGDMQDEFLDLGATLYIMTPEPRGLEATMWRFWATDDCDVPFVCCDADDDMLNAKYLSTLRNWLASPYSFFVQRHLWTFVWPMNASKWGAKPGAFREILQQKTFFQSMKEWTLSYCDVSFGVDEGFLNREVWPRIRHDCFISSPDQSEWIAGGVLLGAMATCIAPLLKTKTNPSLKKKGKKKQKKGLWIKKKTHMYRIPRIISQTWETTQVPAHWAIAEQKWREFASVFGWEYKLWTDEDRRNLIQEKHPDLVQVYDAFPRNIQRADFVRPFIMYYFGGLYCDLDFEPKLREMRALWDFYEHSGAKVAIAKSATANDFADAGEVLTNAFFLSEKGCALWPMVWTEMAKPITDIDWRLRLVRKIPYFDVICGTGPSLLNRVVREYVARYAQDNGFRAIPCEFVSCGYEWSIKPFETPNSAVRLLQGNSWHSKEMIFFRKAARILHDRTRLLTIAVLILMLFCVLFCTLWKSALNSLRRNNAQKQQQSKVL